MAKEPLAAKGHMVHVYDFRTKPGMGDEFIRLFQAVDQSGENPFHHSPAQVKDGVLCRDDADPDHFYLLGEWNDREAHEAIYNLRIGRAIPEHIKLIEGERLVPIYTSVVV